LLSKPKEEQSHDFEGILKMMQKISNRVIDLEKEKEAQKAYKPYYKKREDNNQFKTPPHGSASMNLTEVGMDNFCTFHQQPHSEKNCPQWLNSMTLVMNQLLDSKLTEDSDEEGKGNKTIEKQENDTMFLWDCVSLFDTEKSTLKPENIPMTTKDLNLVNKDNSIISKIKKLQENVRKQPKNNVKDKVPEITIISQDPKQTNKPAKPMED